MADNLSKLLADLTGWQAHQPAISLDVRTEQGKLECGRKYIRQ